MATTCPAVLRFPPVMLPVATTWPAVLILPPVMLPVAVIVDADILEVVPDRTILPPNGLVNINEVELADI